VSFAAITLYVASRVIIIIIIVVVVYFVIDSVRKLLDTPPHFPRYLLTVTVTLI